MSKLFSSLRFRLILLVLLATLPALMLVVYIGDEQRQKNVDDVLDITLALAAYAADKNELLIEDTRVTLIALSHAMNFEGDDLKWLRASFQPSQRRSFSLLFSILCGRLGRKYPLYDANWGCAAVTWLVAITIRIW